MPSSVVCLDLLLLLLVAVSTTLGQSLPGCPSKCGDVEVPYPFGLSRNCSRDETFLLTCNQTSGRANPPTLYTREGFRVYNISIPHGHLDVFLFFARDCYDKNENRVVNGGELKLEVKTPLSISPERNQFIVTGCDAYFWYWDNWNQSDFWTGCLSGCGNLATIVNNTCNGFGCCESNMPKGLRILDVSLNSYYDHSHVIDFNPCSYAFIVDRDKFTFDSTWITTDYSKKAPPQPSTVLDWSIEGTNCAEAIISAGGDNSLARSKYACASANSECLASANGYGYLCNCSAGYTGNPYLPRGCQDIDECKLDRQLYPCNGNCINTQGSYSCLCPAGSYSDDAKKYKCIPKSSCQ